MIDVTTTGAAEMLSPSGARINVSARGARLRTVVRRCLDQSAPGPREFVTKKLGQDGPSGITNAPGSCSAHHCGSTQFLDHNNAMALGKSCRQSVHKVCALALNFSVHAHHAQLRLVTVFGSFLAPRHDALSTSKALHSALVVSWVSCNVSFRVGDDVGDATVQCNCWATACLGIRDLDLAHDQNKPLISALHQCATFTLALDRPVHNSANVSYFWESHIVGSDAPCFRVWLSQAYRDVVLFFPSRRSRYALEASLPGEIEPGQHVLTNVARNITKPREFGTKIRQLLHLCSKRNEHTFVSGSGKSHEALLVGDIPQEPHRVLPTSEAILLLSRWINAIAECFPDQHWSLLTTAHGSQ